MTGSTANRESRRNRIVRIKRVIVEGRKETIRVDSGRGRNGGGEGGEGEVIIISCTSRRYGYIVTDIGGFATFGPSFRRGSSRPLSLSLSVPLSLLARSSILLSPIFSASFPRPYIYIYTYRFVLSSSFHSRTRARARISRSKTKRNRCTGLSRITTMRPS